MGLNGLFNFFMLIEWEFLISEMIKGIDKQLFSVRRKHS